MERIASPTGRVRKSPKHDPGSPRSAVRAVQHMTAVVSGIRAESQGATLTRGRLENVLLGRTASALSQSISSRAVSPLKKPPGSSLMSLIDANQPRPVISNRRSPRPTRSARSRELGKCFANVTFIKTRAEGSNSMYYSTQSTLDESGGLRSRPVPDLVEEINAVQLRSMHGEIQSPSESISETTNIQRTSLQNMSTKAECSFPADVQSKDSDRLSETDLVFIDPKKSFMQAQARRFIASEASPDRGLLYCSKAARALSVRGNIVPQIPFSKSSGIPGVFASAIRKQPPELFRPLSSSGRDSSFSRPRSTSTKIQPPRISSQPHIRSVSSDARTSIKPAARLVFPVPPKRHQLTPRERQALAHKRMRRETTWISDQLNGRALSFATLHRNASASRDASARRSLSAQKTSFCIFTGPQRIASPRVKPKQQWIPAQEACYTDDQDHTPKGRSGELRCSPHYVALSPTYAQPIAPSPVRNMDMTDVTLYSPNPSLVYPQRTGSIDEDLVNAASAKRTMVIEPRRATTATMEPNAMTLDRSLDIKLQGERPSKPMYTKAGQRIVPPQTIKPPARPARPIPPPNHNLQIYKRSPSNSSTTANQPLLRHVSKEAEQEAKHVVLEDLEDRHNSSTPQYVAPGSSNIISGVFDLRESALNRSSTKLDVVNLLPYFYYKQGETITLAQLPEIMKELNYNIDALKISAIKPQPHDQSSVFFQARVQTPQRRATSSGTTYERRRKRPKSASSPRRRI